MATKYSRIKVDGLEVLNKKIDQLDSGLRNILGKAALAGADIIRDEARRRAPFETGALKQGIISQITWDKNKTVAFAGAGMNKDMNNVFVKYSKEGKRYYYPAALEYGTKHAPAHPYIRPSFDSKRAAVRREIQSHVLTAIKGVTKG